MNYKRLRFNVRTYGMIAIVAWRSALSAVNSRQET